LKEKASVVKIKSTPQAITSGWTKYALWPKHQAVWTSMNLFQLSKSKDRTSESRVTYDESFEAADCHLKNRFSTRLRSWHNPTRPATYARCRDSRYLPTDQVWSEHSNTDLRSVMKTCDEKILFCSNCSQCLTKMCRIIC